MATPPSEHREILPDNVKPFHYKLKIHNIELGGSFGYEGEVIISMDVLRSTKEIVLNSHQLIITSAEIGTMKASNISYDKPRQRLMLTFNDDIPIEEETSLKIEFQGTINNTMAGFYRSKYKPVVTPAATVPMDGDHHVMFSTQFESCDARRAFPCFDEPNLKATFEFGIEIPSDQVALSNMPVKRTDKSSKDGFQEVWFENTPVMSTYLLAWAVGDFEYLEDFTKREYNGKPIPVRVYTTRGLKSQGQYALDHAPQVIDYFSEIFGIDYPLPKADLLAVHEFSHGAMENWGLVTYRTTALLFDEKTSAITWKNRIAYVVAHELAHQWFGNLVTMDWWNELWLNEGFATWVGWLAVDKMHPDWNVWPQFVAESMQTAFSLDALRSSHPIEVPVKDALDVDQIFDAISYLKGSSAIIMLSADLGQDKFLEGVSIYLKKHSYGNATTKDLWNALGEASGKDVAALMGPWIEKIGFPVLDVTEKGDATLGFKQSRYLSSGDVTPEDDITRWSLPIGLVGGRDEGPVSLTAKEDTLSGVDYSFYKINKDHTGFYHTKYPPGRLAKIATQIDRLSLSDKIGLVGDAGDLAASGDIGTPELLSLVSGFKNETNGLLWSTIISFIDYIKSVFSEHTAISEGLKNFVLDLISPMVAKLGWESSLNDDFLTLQLRALLISSAGTNGHKEVISEAQNRFKLHLSGDESAIDPNLRAAIFGIVVRYGGSVEYEAIKKEFESGNSVEGKDIALQALGRIQDTDLLPDLFNFVMTKSSIGDVHYAFSALSTNPKTRPFVWKYMQENFDFLFKQLSSNMVVWDRFVRVSLNKFTDLETEKEIAKFFEGKDNRGYDRSLNIVSEKIKQQAAYKARDAKVILEWLQKNGFAS